MCWRKKCSVYSCPVRNSDFTFRNMGQEKRSCCTWERVEWLTSCQASGGSDAPAFVKKESSKQPEETALKNA